MKLTLKEMNGLLNGKCLPSDLIVGETLAEYLVRKFADVEQELAESQREFRAADATIENLQMQLEKIAAELSAVEVIHNEAVFITDEHYEQCPPQVQKMIRTLAVMQVPAYQAFLAEVRAQGVKSLSNAVQSVIAERQRQQSAEGWTSKHDDKHDNNELAFAASCYAFHSAAASWNFEDDGTPYDIHPAPKNWPWAPEWWKPTNPRRDLVKAGALILAEIERIDRQETAQ